MSYHAVTYRNDTTDVSTTPMNNETDNFILIVANEASTNVSIVIPGNVKCLVDSLVKTAQTVVISLNEAQTLLITSNQDLTGIRVSADKKLALFSGNRRAIGRQGSVQAVEQLPPGTSWGTEYYSPETPSAGNGSIIRVVGWYSYHSR